MSTKVVELTCPGCGASLSVNQKVCKFCRRAITVSTFRSVYDMTGGEFNEYRSACEDSLKESPADGGLHFSQAMCYLKLGLYEEAGKELDKAISDNFDNSEAYFYKALTMLDKKIPKVFPRAHIDKMEEYLKAAIKIEPRGIYYYFAAYIRYDYHERKFLNVSPNYKQLFQMAQERGYSEYDLEQLYGMLEVKRPRVL